MDVGGGVLDPGEDLDAGLRKGLHDQRVQGRTTFPFSLNNGDDESEGGN